MTKALMAIKAEIEKLNNDMTGFIADKKIDEAMKIKASLSEKVKAYNEQLVLDTYSECSHVSNDNTMKTRKLCETGYVLGAKAKFTESEGVLIGADIEYEEAMIRLNVLDFMKKYNISTTDLTIALHKLNDRLALKTAMELSKSEITEKYLRGIKGITWVKDIMDTVERGGNPISNSQIEKLLQEVIDIILGSKDDGSKFKALKCDVSYVSHQAYSNDNREFNAVKCISEKKLMMFVTSAASRILKDSAYKANQKIKGGSVDLVATINEGFESKNDSGSSDGESVSPTPTKAKTRTKKAKVSEQAIETPAVEEVVIEK